LLVVILNWNGKDVLRQAIESVKAQTLQPDKIIVVDNASTDGSDQIAKDMGVEVVYADNKHQFITGLNTAFSLEEGLIFFMSNDMVLSRACLQNMRFGGWKVISWPRTVDSNGIEFERDKKSIMTGCFMMDRRAFDVIGDFDINLTPAYYEDVDYSIRAKELGFYLSKEKDALVKHQASHSFSKVYNKKTIGKLCRRNLWYLIKKHGLIRVIQTLCT